MCTQVGCCALVAHMEGDALAVAGVGDCRAVLARATSTGAGSEDWDPIVSLRDHA